MSISLAASPQGRRIGIAAAARSSSQVVVSVAPKPWREGASASYVVSDLQRQHTVFRLYEGDRLHVRTPSDDVDTMFGSLLRASAVAGSLNTEGSESSLLRPEVGPPSWQLTDAPETGSDQDTADLLRLFQRVNLLLSTEDSLRSGWSRSALHWPLGCRQLLDEVAQRISQARRGYRSVVHTGSTIRGQVTARSIARHVATGTPSLTFRYDELTESTPLLGIIAGALDAIAGGLGPKSVLPRPFDDRSLQSDAVRLRRALPEVRSTPPSEALWVGRRLRLNRIDQPWARSLRLALAIVGGYSSLAQERGHRDLRATELSVQTDKVWEWIVTAAMRRSTLDRVLVPGSEQADLAVDPWISHPLQVAISTRPDNIAFTKTSVFIVDAKYKLSPTPSRDDQYQMFAYSHLVRAQGRDVRAVALVYPGQASRGQWLRGRDPFDNAVRLFSLSLPFPRTVDLVSAEAWENYLAQISNIISTQLNLEEASSPTP